MMTRSIASLCKLLGMFMLSDSLLLQRDSQAAIIVFET